MTDQGIQAIINMLYSPNESMRHNAALELKQRQDPRAIQPLVELYVDTDRQEQPDSDGDYSNTVPWAIVSFGKEALPELMKYPYFGGIYWVIGAIADPSATMFLLDALEKMPVSYRFPIINSLHLCGDTRAIPALQRLLEQPDCFDELKRRINSAIQSIGERYAI